jgi:pimeloyl-ACP methyl ester carboxylesterase
MTRKIAVPSATPLAKPGSRGYSATAKIALQEGAARVQEIHHAIAGTTFDVLTRIPSISTTAAIVKQAHDTITNGVYAAIHHGGGYLLDAADAFEKQRADAAPSDGLPNPLANKLRSAINGAFGDHLAASGSVLAISMGLYRQGREVPLTTDALRALLVEDEAGAGAKPVSKPTSKPKPNRICVFIHGLGCSEHCWEADATANPPQIDMPQRLAADAQWTTLTLRYNTGLPIDDNGRQLSALLDELLAAWPAPPDELMIIGHSMGGLLVRSAFAHGISTGQKWPTITRKIICIGTPHLGSPVERLGQLTTSALRLSPYTEPLARVAAHRSQGIQDLRHGPGTHDAQTVDYPPVAWRFIGGSLSDDPESPLSRIVGDGLVTPDSATAHAAGGDVKSVRLGGIRHMSLLNSARVYAQVLAWVEE